MKKKKDFENVKSSFIFALNTLNPIKNATAWHAAVANAAPAAPIAGIGTNTKFKINFNATPTNKAIAGVIIFPIPCNAPFTVCSKTVKIIAKELTCKIKAPSGAFGNSKFKIGPSKNNHSNHTWKTN